MSSPIKAGVIIKTRFVDKAVQQKGKRVETFANYIKYVDRDEATRTDNLHKFNLYNDYMGNPEKSSGLFTAGENSLSSEQVKALKDAFQRSYDNGGILWQTVVSFDNRFLVQLGIYNPSTGLLDEQVLQNAVRRMMRDTLQRENMTFTAVWSAAVHYNTDNIHIHIAYTEPDSTRPVKEVDGQLRPKGYFSAKTLRSMKSKVVNALLENEYTKVDQLMRERILDGKRNNFSLDDKVLRDMWFRVYDNLPADKRQWYYNMNGMAPLRPLLDELTRTYVMKYHREEYAEFQKLIMKQQEAYKVAYGIKGNSNYYAKNKMDTLYASMGNAVLNEMRLYSKSPYEYIYRQADQGQNATPFISRRLSKCLNEAFSEMYKDNDKQHRQLEQEILYRETYASYD